MANLTQRQALALATHRHYKGGLYRVISIGPHTETNEEMVIYVHLFPHQVRVYPRPASVFFSNTADGTPRFQRLDSRTADLLKGFTEGEYFEAVVILAQNLGLRMSAVEDIQDELLTMREAHKIACQQRDEHEKALTAAMDRIAGFEERTNALDGKTAVEWKAACEAAEQRAADLAQKLTNPKASEVGL